MAGIARNRDLRAEFPWVFAEGGFWIPGVEAANAGDRTSISKMDPDHLGNCIAMVKRDLQFVEGLHAESAISGAAAADFRRNALKKIAQMEKALKKQQQGGPI